MDKILITIYVLSIEMEFDVTVPINEIMSKVLNSIQYTIKDLSEGSYEVNEKALLYDENGKVINLNNIVKYSGLKNGSKVLLK